MLQNISIFAALVLNKFKTGLPANCMYRGSDLFSNLSHIQALFLVLTLVLTIPCGYRHFHDNELLVDSTLRLRC